MAEGYSAGKGSLDDLSFSIRPSPALSPRRCSCSQPPKATPQPQVGQEEGKRVKVKYWGSSYPKPADLLLAPGTPQSPGASQLPLESQDTVSVSVLPAAAIGKGQALRAGGGGIQSQAPVPVSLILPAASGSDGLGAPTPRSCFTPLPPPKALAASGEFKEGGRREGACGGRVSRVAARNNRPLPPHLEGHGVHTLAS